MRRAKSGKHKDAGRKSGCGEKERAALTWLCQTSIITKHPKLHTLIYLYPIIYHYPHFFLLFHSVLLILALLYFLHPLSISLSFLIFSSLLCVILHCGFSEAFSVMLHPCQRSCWNKTHSFQVGCSFIFSPVRSSIITDQLTEKPAWIRTNRLVVVQ